MYYRMNDSEIDMEELEARLYGQVHHAANEDEELPNFRPPANIEQSEASAKSFPRYFEDKQPQTYRSGNIHSPFQNQHKPPFFQSNPNFNASENFYKSFGLFTLPDLVINPAVNNIVVLPPPPTQIFTQREPPAWKWSPEKQQLKLDKANEKRKKKREKRARRRQLERQEKRACQKQEQESRREVFKEHRLMTHQNKVVGTETITNHNEQIISKPAVEVICLSETDNSDCEAGNPGKEQAVVVVSSEDERDNKEDAQDDSHVEIKHENAVEVEVCKNSEDKLEKSPKETPNACVNINFDDAKASEQDDDVIYIEPAGLRDIITIDCDESSQTLTIVAVATDNILSQERKELLDTPESTTSNDFLDSTLTLSQNNADDNLSVNNEQGASPDMCETESSCSTYDFTPSRCAIFNEEAFDSPSNLNLDTFTNYIGTRATTSMNIPSILTPLRKAAEARRGNKSKNFSRSSDSSSESDYEDSSKSAHVEHSRKKQKKKRTKRKFSVDSQSDEGIIEDNINKSQALLPNLSPITSDEELNVTDIISDKDRSPQKKQKKSKNQESDESVQKRKIDKVDNVECNKKLRQDGEDETSSSSKHPTEQEVDAALESNDDSYIEVEAVSPIHLDSSSSECGSDIELLNIDDAPSHVTPPQQRTNKKPKAFSDYWTDDMKKFYFESWGGENFSVPEEQQNMSDDPKLWKIISRDQVNLNFIPKGPRCHRCREFGHKAMNCKKQIGSPKCILCGARGHVEARCPNKVCTSCGRRSLYSTTYCSRCANSRYAMCRICSMRGHTPSNCTDLWRRYHLTIKDGFVQQPTETKMKAPRDRWCSGCASRGHFEHDCNYYNRTHPPTNPFIHSYADVYDSGNSRGSNRQQQSSRRETQTQCEVGGDNSRQYVSNEFLPNSSPISNSYGAQTQWEGRGNYSNNIRPLMSVPLNLNALQVYPYNQAVASSAVHPNYYQQFPVYNSVLGPLHMQHQLVPANALNDSRNVENLDTQRIVTESPVESVERSYNSPDLASQDQTESRDDAAQPLNSSTDYMQLKPKIASKLLEGDGVDFLKMLSEHTNLKIKVEKVPSSSGYVCTLEGQDMLKQDAKDAIQRYCSTIVSHSNLISLLCQRMKLSMPNLKYYMRNLQDPDIHWCQLARFYYGKMVKFERGFKNAKVESRRHKIEKRLKQNYLVLNALILGKLKVADGPKHLRILKGWIEQGNAKVMNKPLHESFDYIFKNDCKLDINYAQVIRKFTFDQNLQMRQDVDAALHSGIALCQNRNLTNELKNHKNLYGLVIINNYTGESIDAFKDNLSQMKKRYKKASRRDKKDVKNSRYNLFVRSLLD